MTDENDGPLFERGDVVYGDDPFNHEDIDFWQGRLDSDLVDEAAAALIRELQ